MNLKDKETKIKLRSAVGKLNAMNNPLCRKVLMCISHEAKTVTEIWFQTRLNELCHVSHVLIRLKRARLVTWTRDGKNIYYQADVDEIQRCNKSVIEFLGI